MTLKIKGTLEVDPERGVIYFHSEVDGRTMMRICSLPKPIPVNLLEWDKGDWVWIMDITHMFGCNWQERRRV